MTRQPAPTAVEGRPARARADPSTALSCRSPELPQRLEDDRRIVRASPGDTPQPSLRNGWGFPRATGVCHPAPFCRGVQPPNQRVARGRLSDLRLRPGAMRLTAPVEWKWRDARRARMTEASGRHTADLTTGSAWSAPARTTLKNVSLSCPKRRLSVFTGCPLGKSLARSPPSPQSLSDDQRDLIRPLSRVFTPMLARPDVDLLEGLTTAIIVDQERWAQHPIDGRHGHRCQCHVADPVLPLGHPHIGSLEGLQLQCCVDLGAGAVTMTKAGWRSRSAASSASGGARGARAWQGFPISTSPPYDASQLTARGRADDPGLFDGRMVRLIYLGSGFFDPEQAGIANFTKRLFLADLFHKEPTQDQGRRHQYHLRRPDPERSRSPCCPRSGRDAAAHRPGGRLPDPPGLRGYRLNEQARLIEDQGHQYRRCSAMQISDLAVLVRATADPSVAPACWPAETPIPFVDRSGYLS